MITQHQTARADGTVLFRFTAGALEFDVLSTEAELAECRNFLADDCTVPVGRIRLGMFGSSEVQLIRGADAWSVKVRVCVVAGDDGGRDEQCISANVRSAVLLRSITSFISPSPENAHQAPALELALTPQIVPELAVNRRVLHNAADTRRLITYVATHWTVPHVDVAIDRFAELDRQRAQTRIFQLTQVSEYQSLGAWAAVITVVLGTIKIVSGFNDRTIEERFVDTYVTSAGLWEYALGLAVAAACAWLAGRWLGALWCRLRLLMALCRLWYRARSMEGAS